MKRIIMHWSAGAHRVSEIDRQHYHWIVAGDGEVVAGKFKPEANENPVKGKYAAHTLNCNTGSIGVAVAAMRSAVERPFYAGPDPITPEQLDAFTTLVADLCKKYGIPVTPQTVLTHAEVQPTLGIKQKGKWDIAWLPGMKETGDPVAVGDRLRSVIKAKLAVAPRPVAPTPPATPLTLDPKTPAQPASQPVQRPKTGFGTIIALIGVAVAAIAAVIGLK